MSRPRLQIQLLGLPGAGKKRLKQALQSYFDCGAGDFAHKFEKNFVVCVPKFLDWASGRVVLPKNCLNWAVIDVRSFLEGSDAVQQQALLCLEAMLFHCEAVIWMFAESSELEVQAKWQKWLRQWQQKHHRKLTQVSCFAQTFQFPHQGLEQLLQGMPNCRADFCVQPIELETLRVQCPKMVLSHLLFVLEASRQAGQLSWWRVKGCLMTAEYVNPVAIEGTVNRLDTYAADLSEDSPEMGWITLEGLNLDAEVLQEGLRASVAQGDWDKMPVLC